MKKRIIAVMLVFILSCNFFVFSEGMNINEDTIVSSSNDKYIIITSEEFKNYDGENSFHDLIAYHSNEGMECSIVTVESIENSYNGMDRAEKIRNFICDFNPKYVLLGGDDDLIPGRNLMCRWSNDLLIHPAPSDLYYSCPDVTWYKGPTYFVPEDKDLSEEDNILPSYTLTGGGFFEENAEETNYLKWTYEEGAINKHGWCNITFEEPADFSDLRFMNFNIKTYLKEYELDDNGNVGPSGIAWDGFRCEFTDSDGTIDKDIKFKTSLFNTGYNSGDWENFELSIQASLNDMDYSKIKTISFKIKRWFCSEHDSVELNPNDYVMLDNIHFTDYSDTGFAKKDGSLNPTVCVGRACVDNTGDIKNIVGKTLCYLNSNYPDDVFLENVMLVDSHNGETDQGINKLNELKSKYLDNAGYNSVKYYDKDGVARENIFNADNTNILIYMGHGLWNGYEMGIFNSDIDKFSNINPFFEYSVGCTVGAFDKEDCYAEYLTVKTDNGAFAGIWHTKTSWSNYFDASNYFFKAICDWDYTIGEAHNYQIQNKGGSGRYTFTLFGDPAVKLKKPIVNNAPLKPDKPVGEIDGKINDRIGYTTKTTDQDHDKVSYGWDWDGDLVVDEWTDFYYSGREVTTVHSWEDSGTYDIRVIAKDEHGLQSEWSDPLTVTMPKSIIFINTIIQRITDRFPILGNLVQFILNS